MSNLLFTQTPESCRVDCMQRKKILYSWPDWVDIIKKKAKTNGKVFFFCYGSLVNPDEIKRRHGRLGKNNVVVAKGFKRIFNYGFFDWEFETGKYKKSKYENHDASLNVVFTGNDSDVVNGIINPLYEKDIDDFVKHEAGYDVQEVEYVGFEHSEIKGKAYILIGDKSCKEFGHLIRDDHFPNESYLKICLDGAKKFGKKFLDMWLDNAYLGNGEALIDSNFYKQYKDAWGDPYNEI